MKYSIQIRLKICHPREALPKPGGEHPRTAGKLTLAVYMRIAKCPGDTADKLHTYSQMVQAMQREIDHLVLG